MADNDNDETSKEPFVGQGDRPELRLRPDTPIGDVPAGALHPLRIREGVIDGVADYGNKIGLPTVAGAILYDPGYTTNPLVFAGCIGQRCLVDHTSLGHRRNDPPLEI